MLDRSAALRARLRVHLSGVAIALLAFAIAAGTLLGGFAPFDRFLSDRTFGLQPHQASGSLVLVEIDPKSLQKLATWPWSRAYHAALIDRLLAAGASQVAFDIDFSAASAPEADAALAQAIDRAKGRVVLATFSQADPAHARGISASTPLAQFGAATLGLVNVFADPDGRLRSTRLAEDRLPGAPATLAAILAAPLKAQPNAFAIDYAIAPATITRLSYVDVLTGAFDPSLVAGKKVLVGANAIELGDRYAVPIHGILAGVEIQALAYETLMLGRAVHAAGSAWVLLGLVLLSAVMLRSRNASWPRIHIIALSGAIVALGVGIVAQTLFATTVATAPWLAMVAGGYVIAVIREARDQTRSALDHRAAAARQRALMQGVFQDSFDGILIIDALGNIELANAAASRLLETDPASLVGRPATKLLAGLDLSDHGSPGAPVAGLTVRTPSGHELALAVAVTRSRPVAAPDEDAADVWIVTFRDESARYAAEQAREQALRELAAASTAKNEFLARISHELRTPLSAIIGFATIISEQSIGPIGNPKYAEYARDVTNGGKHLLDLVNDIIDVVRIEAGQFEIRGDVFEARSLLMGSATQTQALADFGTRTLRCEVAPGAEAIRSDPHALSRTLAKLLENAVKFTGPRGEILLRAAPGPEGAVVIEVQDNGIGIAGNALKNVVGAFSQVSGGLNRPHEGIGIGLHLAHRIMTLLGGRLEIESELHAGTTVRLILPAAAVEASQAA